VAANCRVADAARVSDDQRGLECVVAGAAGSQA
jgi:hypothetical protein